MQHFAYFLDKLRQTPDGDGSLLDHSIFVYGSGISDGNNPLPSGLPIGGVAAGRTLKGGRHVRYGNDTPLANLYVSVLDKLGARRWTSSATARQARLPDRHLSVRIAGTRAPPWRTGPFFVSDLPPWRSSSKPFRDYIRAVTPPAGSPVSGSNRAVPVWNEGGMLRIGLDLFAAGPTA